MSSDLTEMDLKCIEDVHEHGWQALSVSGDQNGPGFTYSIGWPVTVNQPDVLVFGLPSELAHALLSDLFSRLKNGLKLSHGDCIAELIKGYDCAFREIHPSRYAGHVNYSLWYCKWAGLERSTYRAMQMFWPEKGTGFFPWEDGSGDAITAAQPDHSQARCN
ncbi:hypothetical protein GCM10007148_12730 [Parvularcula lutaonensis]|nr:hypothetical protein GCM10007148_12730 [Parvularcula lutaonensis]